MKQNSILSLRLHAGLKVANINIAQKINARRKQLMYFLSNVRKLHNTGSHNENITLFIFSFLKFNMSFKIVKSDSFRKHSTF